LSKLDLLHRFLVALLQIAIEGDVLVHGQGLPPRVTGKVPSKLASRAWRRTSVECEMTLLPWKHEGVDVLRATDVEMDDAPFSLSIVRIGAAPLCVGVQVME